jgi:hypothetical protein
MIFCLRCLHTGAQVDVMRIKNRLDPHYDARWSAEYRCRARIPPPKKYYSPAHTITVYLHHLIMIPTFFFQFPRGPTSSKHVPSGCEGAG